MKSIFPDELSPIELQAILQTSVAPRPIALASTIDKEENRNVSPFSFFNVFSSNPPILIFSPARRVRDNTIKHTLENVLEIAEVVIGVVNFDMVQQVSLSSTEYEENVNEFIKSGLTEAKAELVKPSLIQESPVNFECKVIEVKALGKNGGAGNLVICEVVKIHINENYVDENGKLIQQKLNLVSRLGGNWYGKTTKETLFEVPKPLVTKGIGFNLLPKAILQSSVFSKNDLAMLANVEQLPLGVVTSDKNLHNRAKELLEKMQIAEAWQVLVSI